jgi:hypothetical protein
MFTGASVQVLAARSSNHKLLLLVLDTDMQENDKSKRGFKFEMSWTLDEDYQHIIEEAWNVVPNDNTWSKLSKCRTSLIRWGNGKLGNNAVLNKQKTKELEVLQRHEGLKDLKTVKQ